VRHHLRGIQRDPAQHHRRAGPRPTGRTEARRVEGSSVTTPPAYVPGHGLLAGKTVVVTAAAGTGIGSAVARRAIEEGASVLISDFHERRLGETADRLAEETGTRPDTQVCNVTVEEDVQALVAAAADRLGGIDVMV